MTDSEPDVQPETPGNVRSPRSSALRAWGRGVRLPAVFVGALICGILISYVADRVTHSDRVLRGVVLADTVLAGRDARDLRRILARMRQDALSRSLTFSVSQKPFRATLEELGADVDLEAHVAAALELGRSGSALEQFAWWLGRLVTVHRFALESTLNPARLEERLEQWETAALPDRADPGAIRYDGGRLAVQSPRAGRRIDRRGAAERVRDCLAATGSSTVDLPVVREQPRIGQAEVDAALLRARAMVAGPVTFTSKEGTEPLVLSVDDIGRALSSRVVVEPSPRMIMELDRASLEAAIDSKEPSIEQPSRSARFDVRPGHKIEIVPSEIGVSIDVEGVLAFLLSLSPTSQRTAKLPLRDAAPPALSTDQAERLNISKLVASFSTYHRCCEKRVQNIHRIADLVDGTVVLPGETFSLNTHVGPRTPQNGFVLAPGIEEGDMVETYGGGISQFTTTLFNAVLDGGYEIIQRQPHSYYFSRYPMGHEATLSYPTPDLAFKNDTRNGLLIKTQYGSKYIKVSLYGDNEGRKVVRDVGKRFDITDPPNEYLPNETMSPTSAVLKSAGTPGWSVIVARSIQLPDGGTTRQSRKVTYNPRPRLVEVHPCNIPEGIDGYTGEECPEQESPDAGMDGGAGLSAL